jgi:DNA-binding NtrC family response regulator
VAQALHNLSPRRGRPFVAVNCAAISRELVESELFGHEKGAFTGADARRQGRFEAADGGTILLDEIGDISEAVQVRLLRVLEEKVFEPLGSTKPIKTNARVISATHRNLEERVRQGRFREDLYYRINVVKISLPPLAERKEDIPVLVDHFVERFNRLTGKKIMGLSRQAIAALMLHEWSGNVRELENAIEHAFVLCEEGLIRRKHLPSQLIPANDSVLVPTGVTLKGIEKGAIEEALRRNQWRKVATAGELGIDKNTLRRKILRHGIHRP